MKFPSNNSLLTRITRGYQYLKQGEVPQWKESGMMTRKPYLIPNTKFGKIHGNTITKISELMTVILKQGWVPVDPIFVWQHPEVNDKFVVCEGNTRLWALRRILEEFQEKEALLNDIESKGSRAISRNRIDELRKEIDQQRMVIEQTKILQVKPIAAKDTEQLKEKLSIVLGVRHLNGAKKWHNYPESMYLYNKYQRMFIDEYGEDEWIDNKRIEPEVLKKQAQLDSLEPPKLKKKIIAASRHTVFRELYRINVEQARNTFRDGDHFLFENLEKNNDERKIWIRSRLS